MTDKINIIKYFNINIKISSNKTYWYKAIKANLLNYSLINKFSENFMILIKLHIMFNIN